MLLSSIARYKVNNYHYLPMFTTTATATTVTRGATNDYLLIIIDYLLFFDYSIIQMKKIVFKFPFLY